MATETAKDKRKAAATKPAATKGKGAKAAKPEPDEEEEAEEEEEPADAEEEAEGEDADDEEDAPPAKGKPGASAKPATAAPAKPAAAPRNELAARIDAAKEKVDKYIAEQSERLVVDDNDLNGECKVQASSFLAAAAKHNTAAYNLQLAKAEQDAKRANAGMRTREQLSAAGEKITEALVESKLATDPAVQDASRKVAFCTFQKDQYGSVQRAWEHKRDMLIQMGSTERAAFRAETTVNDGPAVGPKGKPKPAPAAKPADDEDDEEVDDTDDEPVTRRKPAAKAAAAAKPKSKPRPVEDEEDEEEETDD